MQAIILAAGVGTRLGRPFPKSLSMLPSGERILGRQIRLLNEAGIRTITVVVGFKKSLIMEEYPDVLYSYNPVYYVTNTSKSLLHPLRHMEDDVLWMNGDVIFDPEVLQQALNAPAVNSVCVDKKRCADEEVKYKVDAQGNIAELSKSVSHPHGEAVGINIVRKESLPAFVQALEQCLELDYFEMGMELCIQQGIIWRPLDISAFRCIEVDFMEDWEAAQKLFPHTCDHA